MGSACGRYDEEDEDEDEDEEEVGEPESHSRGSHNHSTEAGKKHVQIPPPPPPNPDWTPGTPSPPTAVMTHKEYIAPVLPNTVQTHEGVEQLQPEDVYRHMREGSCVLVDVRDKDRASGLIEGAVHVPVVDPVTPFAAKIPWMREQFADKDLVVFTCQYCAHRGPFCANYYRERTNNTRQRVAIMVGGFRAWEGKGLPVQLPGGCNVARSQSANEYAVMQGQIFTQQHAAR